MHDFFPTQIERPILFEKMDPRLADDSIEKIYVGLGIHVDGNATLITSGGRAILDEIIPMADIAGFYMFFRISSPLVPNKLVVIGCATHEVILRDDKEHVCAEVCRTLVQKEILPKKFLKEMHRHQIDTWFSGVVVGVI